MLKAIGWVLKTTVFAVVILILGNWIRWDGKTVSDQVKSKMAFATRSSPSVEKTMKQMKSLKDRISTGNPAESEQISQAEREKLRSLMKNL